MIKEKKYSNYTKKELIEEINIWKDNYHSILVERNRQAEYINQNYIPIEYIEAFKRKVRHIAPAKAVIDWLLENWEKENETV